MRTFLAWKGSAPHSVRVASRVLSRLLLVLAALELVYVIAGNVALRSEKLREAINSSDDVKIDFSRASTPWPGRLNVEGLSFRLEDYNVQFLIEIERASFDLHLTSLARRTFHAEGLRAEGVGFRMRHKVKRVENAARLAAYPTIPGFADPPLYSGPKPPDIPDAEYDLWQVRIDDVEARVRELWALEYRYRGAGVARGSFMVRPSRGFEVTGATLELDGGRLSAADRNVAERLRARIGFDAPYNDTRNVSGMAVLEKISMSLRGQGEEGDLSFLDLYLGPKGLHAMGRLETSFDAKVRNGAVEPGTRADLRLTEATVGAKHSDFTGNATLAMLAPGDTDTLEFGFASDELRGADRDQARGPKFEGVTAKIAVAPRLLSQPLRVVETSASLHAGEIPALAWFEPWFRDGSSGPRLGGSARVGFHVGQRGGGRAEGALSVTARGASFRSPSFELRTNASLHSTFQRDAREAPFHVVSNSSFDDLVLGADGTKSEPLALRVRTEDLKIDASTPRLDGHFTVSAARIDGVLPLAIGFAPLRSILAGALGIDALAAKAKLALSPASMRLDLLSAKSGGLAARGRLEAKGGDPVDGRILLSTRLANLGIRIEKGELDFEPLVSDDWLREPKVTTTTQAPRIPRPRAATRLMLSDDPGSRVSTRGLESPQPERAPKRPSERAP